MKLSGGYSEGHALEGPQTAELKRRGRRIATIKHGHHAFESDQPGRDSWRHFNEGGAEATLMCGTGKIALTMRIMGEPDPQSLIAQFYAGRGYDLVLVEGWKTGALPKVEVFRGAVHDEPLTDRSGRGGFVAVVTDAPARWADAQIEVIPLGEDHVARLCDFLEQRFIAHAR